MKVEVLQRLILLALVANLSSRATASSYPLRIEFVSQFAESPLALGSLTHTNASGQLLSITRLDFLVSNIAVRRADGLWYFPSNSVGYISATEGHTVFEALNIPQGGYRSVRFNVGLPAKENHKDPAGFPPGHPLNPIVNGLHWGWSGGYVFLALEGDWVKADGKRGGYSYHLATDARLMSVELPLDLDVTGGCALEVVIDVEKIFCAKHPIQIKDDSNSTHSRQGDTLAKQLCKNAEQAFRVGTVRPLEPTTTVVGKIQMAATATPFQLAISSFFPRPALPRDNPLTEEGVELGRRLFNDARLSINNGQSCASCHQSEAAFTDGTRYSLGAEGQIGRRNVMPLLNLAWKSAFFWDGRAKTLREQVLQPIENPIEMHESITGVVAKLKSIPGYELHFARAFGAPEISAERLALALEQFLLTQVSHDSKFDRALRGKAELSEQEKRGFELFQTEYDPRRGQFGADCFHCHGGPLFSDYAFHNNGLDLHPKDAGRFIVTARQPDRGKFNTPSLRNVAVTAPYMHDGRFATLEAVVEHYSSGVRRSETLDPNLAKHPDGGVHLSSEDKSALVAFLHTLTDERFLTNGPLARPKISLAPDVLFPAPMTAQAPGAKEKRKVKL